MIEAVSIGGTRLNIHEPVGDESHVELLDVQMKGTANRFQVTLDIRVEPKAATVARDRTDGETK